MSALSFGCFSHFQPFPDFALPYSFFFFTFVSKLNLNQEHHKKHKSSAQQPTMAQEEAQQKLYNNAQAQSPSNKFLLWALFMKHNLRFGLVGQFILIEIFLSTSYRQLFTQFWQQTFSKKHGRKIQLKCLACDCYTLKQFCQF